jgi:eukaryotic-like serine/threonine-protein kinase
MRRAPLPLLALALILVTPPLAAARHASPSAADHAGSPLPAIRWQVKVGQRVEAAPVAGGEGVYLATDDGSVVALDAAAGAVRWRFAAGGSPTGPLTVADGVVYVATLADTETLHAIDAGSGEERWQQSIAVGLLSAAVVADGTVYAVGGTIQGGALLAWQAATGDRLWSLPLHGAVAYTVGVAAGTAFVGADKTVVAVDTTDGTERWSTNVGEWVMATGTGDEGRVYGTTLDGTLLALDSATGAVRWRFRPGFQLDQLQGWTDAPVEVAGIVYAPSSQGIYALDAQTGAARWHAGLGWIGGVAVADGTVYATTDVAPLVALDAATGVPLWQVRPSGPTVGAPAVAAGRVYLGSEDGVVAALDLGAGPVLPVDGMARPTLPTSDQLLLLGGLRGLPLAPAYVGLWRLTYAPGAELPAPAFPGPAVGYLEAGNLGWANGTWESGRLRNHGTAPAVLLVAAVVPASAMPLSLGRPGLTVERLGGGVAPELPVDRAMVTLTRRVYPAGAATPPELTVWPEVLAVESGAVALTIVAAPAAVLEPGEGVLVPGGAVWGAREATKADQPPESGLVAGCGGSRVPALDSAAGPVASPGTGPTAAGTGFVVLELELWADFELGNCAASPADFSFAPVATATPSRPVNRAS